MNPWMFAGIIALAVAVSTLLSGMEAGVFALSRFRIRRLARQGDARAIRLQRYLDQPENFLWTILIGNTLAAWVVISTVTIHVEEWLGDRPVLFLGGMGVVLFLFYAFADLIPKLVFRRYPNRLCLMGVVPFTVLHTVLSPLVSAVEGVSSILLHLRGGRAMGVRLLGSRAELRHVIQESSSSLTREELVMINRILDLQGLRVRDVMTPIDQAVTLDASQTVGELLDVVRERNVSYVPLWKYSGPQRRVLGVVTVSSIIFEENLPPSTPLDSLVQPALFLDESTRLEDALRQMQRARHRLAIVLNPARRETGVVTLNDILRAMFGEVRL